MVAVRSDSQLAFLGRIFWMMAGPACLLVSTVMILNSPGAGWRTGADIVYWVALGGMILGRWVEHQAGSPRNAMPKKLFRPKHRQSRMRLALPLA